jgi:enamine deaminase RidA (YjgF/YER057c/UK114 family)
MTETPADPEHPTSGVGAVNEPVRRGRRARAVNSPDLAPPIGFAHAVVAGNTVYLGGQTAQDKQGHLQGETMPEQFDRAAANLLTALKAAGGEPDDLVTLQVFVTDVDEYRASLVELGRVWRRHFGKHYPAMGLFGINRLFDGAAKVELMGVAKLPKA